MFFAYSFCLPGETECDLTTHFRCDEGQCITKEWLCDEDFDCVDGSDEGVDVGCGQCTFSCFSWCFGEFICLLSVDVYTECDVVSRHFSLKMPPFGYY